VITLVIKRSDGSKREIPLDLANGDGLGVQLSPGGYIESLPNADLTGLVFDDDVENPGLTAVMGRGRRVFPLDPQSKIVVTRRDRGGRESFVVAELADLSLKNGDERE
jgi:hypothetical protein